jgi:NAD(P)-dependent dehydrogenase (short-subunit alcohol dehydrogenase family)
MQRPETIQETARLVNQAGGTGIAVQVDHTETEQVRLLIERIGRDHARLDLLVNDIWGGDPLTQWDVSFWEHHLDNGMRLLRNAVDTHIITSWHAAPLMIRTAGGLIVEITGGIDAGYRGSLFYDLAKASVIRLAIAQAAETRTSRPPRHPATSAERSPASLLTPTRWTTPAPPSAAGTSPAGTGSPTPTAPAPTGVATPERTSDGRRLHRHR